MLAMSIGVFFADDSPPSCEIKKLLFQPNVKTRKKRLTNCVFRKYNQESCLIR